MNISIRTICGVSLGFEIVETKYMPKLNDDGTYLAFDLFIIRIVIEI